VNEPTGGLEYWLQVGRNAAYLAFSAFAGGLGYILRSMEKGDTVHASRVFWEMLGSGFSGFIVLMLCKVMAISPEWTGIIVGITGWLGAQATILGLEGVARRKLGLDRTTANENPPAQ
jgi:hypothetical protein